MDSPPTQVAHQPPHVIGDAAMAIDPAEPYRLFWPLHAGRLNTSPGYSAAAVRGLSFANASLIITCMSHYPSAQFLAIPPGPR